MWTLSTLLHNESTFIPLMFAFSFDLTISVQISQFSVASGMKELITLLGAWNRLKKIGMIFPPSEINLGLNTGVRYTPCAESLSLTPKQFLSAQLDLLPSLRSFVRILCKTGWEPFCLTAGFVRAWWHIWNVSISFEGPSQKPSRPVGQSGGWGT